MADHDDQWWCPSCGERQYSPITSPCEDCDYGDELFHEAREARLRRLADDI